MAHNLSVRKAWLKRYIPEALDQTEREVEKSDCPICWADPGSGCSRPAQVANQKSHWARYAVAYLGMEKFRSLIGETTNDGA